MSAFRLNKLASVVIDDLDVQLDAVGMPTYSLVVATLAVLLTEDVPLQAQVDNRMRGHRLLHQLCQFEAKDGE